MQDPIETLIKLNEITTELNNVQILIDYGRTIAPMDQYFQLALDRKQTEVDEKRVLVAQTMADIRNRN